MYHGFQVSKIRIVLLQQDNSTITAYNLNYQNLIRTKLIMFHVSKKDKKKTFIQSTQKKYSLTATLTLRS